MRSGSRHGRQVYGRWKSPTATDSEVAPQAVEEARFGLGNGAALSLARGALSRELNLAALNLEVPVLGHATVAARHVRNASSRRTRSVRREVEMALDVEGVLKCGVNGQESLG
jgi:hypothetical protein